MYAICNVIYGYPLSDILYNEPPMPPEIKDELLELVEEGDDGGKFLHSYYSGCGDYKPCAIGIECAEFDETQYTELTELYQKSMSKATAEACQEFLDWFRDTDMMSEDLKKWLLDYYKDSPKLFFLWSTS